MTRTIYKYPFEITDVQQIELPKGARILHVDVQVTGDFDRQVPCLWAEVETQAEKVMRTFYLFGTGHMMPDEQDIYLFHVGSFLMRAGVLVFHLYEMPTT